MYLIYRDFSFFGQIYRDFTWAPSVLKLGTLSDDAIQNCISEWRHAWRTECHVVGLQAVEPCHLVPMWSQAGGWVTSARTNTIPVRSHDLAPVGSQAWLTSSGPHANSRWTAPHDPVWPVRISILGFAHIVGVGLKRTPVWPTTWSIPFISLSIALYHGVRELGFKVYCLHRLPQSSIWLLGIFFSLE